MEDRTVAGARYESWLWLTRDDAFVPYRRMLQTEYLVALYC